MRPQLPSRRGIAQSRQGKAAQFVDEFMRALQENRLSQGGHGLCGPRGRGIWEDPWADLEPLKEALQGFTRTVHKLRAFELSELLCELSLVIWQLRAWFTIGSALLVLEILGQIPEMPTRLPTTDSGGDPGLAALRLIEGYVLFCVAQHEQLAEAGEVVGRILRKKRLPPCTSVRVEAALASFGCIETTAPSLQERCGNDWLDSLATALAPDVGCKERLAATRRRLEAAIEGCFGLSRFEFFGSAVNGFETSSSDLDVVVLPREEALRDGSKYCAAKCVEIMGRKLVENEEEWGIYVTDLVTNARVPVLKCRSLELIDIDVTFNNLLPMYNSRLLKAYSSLDERVAKLGRLVKCWARCRQVHEALEGTLSSYSHCILLIHYLQKRGVVPILQEKLPSGSEELFDGIHDVWFLNPNDLTHDDPKWRDWEQKRPRDATLRGLLAGYFHYLAYELRAHSSVASIRARNLHKEDYFRQMLLRKKELEAVATGVALPEEEHEAGCEVPEDVEDAPEAEASESNEERHEEPASPAVVVPSPVVGPTVGPSEFEPPAQKYKLPAEEHELQQAMSQRQVLCIDDPMEFGRSLGASFQGFERLCFEWRRAFHLLVPPPDEGQDLVQLRELFHESNLRAIYQLERHRNFPQLVERMDRRNKIPWAQGQQRSSRSWYGQSWRGGKTSKGEGHKGDGKGDGYREGHKGDHRGDSHKGDGHKGDARRAEARAEVHKDGHRADGKGKQRRAAEGEGLWQ